MAPRREPLASASPRTDSPSPAGSYIELAGIVKQFGARSVLRGLDLQIEPGSFVSIIGRSGSGKSTLLRLIAGLETPSSGTVRLDGADFAGLAPCTTVMFQDSRLLPWQRVIDNVALAASRGARESSLEALRQVGLADRARDWPLALSGGQRQRVALARALASKPHVLLLDEPLGALDALTRVEMQRLIESLWSERRFTAVLVTHDVMEAITLSDRVVVLREGAIAFDLPIDLPRPRPSTASEVAEFEAAIIGRLQD
ncbi:MAG: ATP-binding cassette domain-containing protein [Acetobacteraceae bacterium]|nr:ATP-binding cassette domain-containing protein [Acetobacteraceae bacterium]